MKDGLLHEALHATMIAQSVFEDHVLEAEAVEADVALKTKAWAIADMMGELYQMIGAKEAHDPQRR